MKYWKEHNEKNVTWEKWNIKKATWNMWNTRKVKYGKSVIWKKCNVKRVNIGNMTRIVQYNIQINKELCIGWTRLDV